MQFVSELNRRVQEIRGSQAYFRDALQQLISTRSNIQNQLDTLSLEYSRKTKSLEQKLDSLKSQNEALLRQNDLLKSDLETYQTRLLQKDKLIALLLTQSPRLQNSHTLDHSKNDQSVPNKNDQSLVNKNDQSLLNRSVPSLFGEENKIRSHNVPPPMSRKIRAQTTTKENGQKRTNNYYSIKHQIVESEVFPVTYPPVHHTEVVEAPIETDHHELQIYHAQYNAEDHYSQSQDPQSYEVINNSQEQSEKKGYHYVSQQSFDWSKLRNEGVPREESKKESPTEFFRQLSLSGSQVMDMEESAIQHVERDHSTISQDAYFERSEVMPTTKMVKKVPDIRYRKEDRSNW